MNAAWRLADQHFHEWESNLRHVDRTTGATRDVRDVPFAMTKLGALFSEIVSDQEGCAQALREMHRQPFDDWAAAESRGEGPKGAFAVVGEQLDRVLAAMFELDRND